MPAPARGGVLRSGQRWRAADVEDVPVIDLPTVAIQDLQTTVSVPDGGTLLLGGQRIAGEMDREMGAPVLSKVPLLNRLFTNRMKVRDEQTLLILVKPRIIIQRDEEELAKIRGDFR